MSIPLCDTIKYEHFDCDIGFDIMHLIATSVNRRVCRSAFRGNL